MSKTFAIPIEKCNSIKENVFNNNQYNTVSVTNKIILNEDTQEPVFERNDTIYSINGLDTETQKISKDDFIDNLLEQVNGTKFSLYLKKVANTSEDKYEDVSHLSFADYIQNYIEFSGETNYFGFDVSNIYFSFKAKANVTVVDNPYIGDDGSGVMTFVYKDRVKTAIKECDDIVDTNYIITEYPLNTVLGRDKISYFKKYGQPFTNRYIYINSSNVFNSTITTTNGVDILGDTQHEMFIQYKVDALNNKVYYYVCMLISEFRNDTLTYQVTTKPRVTATYRTNIAFGLYNNDIFVQSDDETFKTGTGAIADYELYGNNLICNQNTIKYKDPNDDYAIKTINCASYVTSQTKKFYENGRPTVEITLPIMPLEDLDGNVVVLGSGNNAQNILVGDTFKITKNGTWDNLKMYQVTTVETCFNGAYRWVIKAKETYELIDIRYFVPQIEFKNNSYYILKNSEDFGKILTIKGFGYDDFYVGIIVKRHHTKNRNYRQQSYDILFTPSHAVSFNQIKVNDGSETIYQFYLSESNNEYSIENLEIILDDGILTPKGALTRFYNKDLPGNRVMYNLVGICLKQGNNISKKSKNFIPVSSNGVELPTEKKYNIKW